MVDTNQLRGRIIAKFGSSRSFAEEIGMKEATLKEMMQKKPEFVITHAVKGMLPKGPLGRQMLKKLHVYAGPEHNHAAQKPETLDI